MSDLALSATGRVTFPGAGDVFEKMCAHLEEHIDLRRDGSTARAETADVRIDFSWRRETFEIVARAADDASMVAVREMVVSHLREFGGEAAGKVDWTGAALTAAAPKRSYRRLTVTGVADITPHMRRLTLAGDDLAVFARGGVHLRLLLPHTPGADVGEPVITDADRMIWPQEAEQPQVRVYTIRRIDVAAGTLAIDFLLHGEDDHCPGAGFARRARAGDRLAVYGPVGRDVPPARRYVLAGDETALPMIARMLEEMPAEARAEVLLECDGPDDELVLAAPGNATIRWVHRRPAPAPASAALEAAFRALPIAGPAEDIYVIFAAEAAAARRVRGYLRADLGLPVARYMSAGFWDA
ncbi:siderophore-interacting protein [Methylobrevis pamukkalensis]|uniref:Vibriobactin utilization protein ViuB n=1 Tax=Methylobrevis pamukkalensis TaxID=1439726 RepID=A0A1E3HAX1_9HYPH|nr:siderophore-interacting protein [Methylobrevis pamukkalensis]ODN72591.1 Vibriobactin utilization protein ViuB [Methylobrevis pamukkalensis]